LFWSLRQLSGGFLSLMGIFLVLDGGASQIAGPTQDKFTDCEAHIANYADYPAALIFY